MSSRCFFNRTGMLATLVLAGVLAQLEAGTLTGSFSSIASGSNVNLTALGKLDWVQWGLGGDYAVNRKAGLTPLISNFTLISRNSPTNPLSFSSPYWFEDTASSYCSWEDGDPVVGITSNYTRVLAYSYPVAGGSGFKLSVPANTTTNTLSVFVGTLSARGEFRASLSGPGQPDYFHSPLDTDVNGVYSINFSANAAGQTLTIEWALTFMGSNGYVTLQAAALTAPSANNPPFALITHPTNDTTFAAPANIVLEAFAEDFDGTVTNVVFYANSNRLSQDANAPYAFTWNDAPMGYHQLTAVATDDRGATRSSVPVEIFVHGTNGSQTGAFAAPPPAVDLTAEGTSDWVHWGLTTDTSVNRKTGVPPQISNFTPVGTATVSRYADNYTGYSWSDGNPTTAADGTHTGVFLTNFSSGFQLTLPADNTPRLLRLYVGAYAARGRLLAYLSDFSAQPYIDKSIFDAGWDNEYAVYSIAYRAASPGQQLIVSYHSVEVLDGAWGNVTLQAATLQGESINVGQLAVLPAGGLSSSGTVGGPFSPSSIGYTLTNNGGATLNWTASKTANWVNLSTTSGSLAAGDSTTVTVSLNSAADSLAAGSYNDTVSFVNTTTGNGNTSRSVSLLVESTIQFAIYITNAARLGDDFVLSFNTQTGQDYTVEYADALPAPAWSNLITRPGNGALVTVTNHNARDGRRYFRVRTP
jgi:hypothetical protein